MCKEAGKHIYGEEKNQPIKTNLEWTQALELVEKNIKIVTETGCQFQKVKLRCGRYIKKKYLLEMKAMRSEMKDILAGVTAD